MEKTIFIKLGKNMKIDKKLLYWTVINSPVGKLFLASQQKDSLSILQYSSNRSGSEIIERYSKCYAFLEQNQKEEFFSKVIQELESYFSGDLKKFNLELNMDGTSFQRSVWQTLLTIPYGITASYNDIAQQIGNSKASRAVGSANNKNPIAIIIPCHRVIRKNGFLSGYRGGTQVKSWLLKHENNN